MSLTWIDATGVDDALVTDEIDSVSCYSVFAWFVMYYIEGVDLMVLWSVLREEVLAVKLYGLKISQYSRSLDVKNLGVAKLPRFIGVIVLFRTRFTFSE